MIRDAKREYWRSVMSDASFNKKFHCSEEQDDGWMRSVPHLDLLLRSILHFKSLAVCHVTDEENVSDEPSGSARQTQICFSARLRNFITSSECRCYYSIHVKRGFTLKKNI